LFQVFQNRPRRNVSALKQNPTQATSTGNRGPSEIASAPGSSAPAPEGDTIMTTTSFILAAAIMAQPMLLVGIVIGNHIADRRAA
jgi:hypothetical protein